MYQTFSNSQRHVIRQGHVLGRRLSTVLRLDKNVPDMNSRRDADMNIHTMITRTSVAKDRRMQVLKMVQRHKALVRVFAWSKGMDPLDVCLFVEDDRMIWCRTLGAPKMFEDDADAILMATACAEDWINYVDEENASSSSYVQKTTHRTRPSMYMPMYPLSLDITAYSKTCMYPFRTQFESNTPSGLAAESEDDDHRDM